MPEQLKIIIDADVNSAIAGVKELSKVISLDFAKATASAANAANKLSGDVAASVQKINASLSGLKVTSLDVSVNTSTIDASIKSIQSKFAAITDVNLGVLADTSKAEAAIKNLISELATLKGSEIFIKANDVQALKAINEIEAELNALVDKQIKLNVNTTDAIQKVSLVEKELAGLQSAVIPITANDTQALSAINKVEAELAGVSDKEIKLIIDSTGVSGASKVISGDFVKATEVAASAGFNLSERFAAATARINASIDKMVADALGKFTQLKSFKPDFGVLSFDASKVLSGIEQVKAELNSISGKAINLSVNTTEAQAGIKKVKADIDSIRAKPIIVPVDTLIAQRNVNTLSETIETLRGKAEARKFFITTETDITKIAAYNKEIQKLEDEVRRLQNIGKKGFELFIVPNQTINSVKSLTQSVAAFGGGVKTFIPPAIAGFNKLPSSISPVITQLKALEKQSTTTGAGMTNVFSKAFGGLRSLAALIPGIGLGGLIGLAATAVNSLTQGFFDAAFGASKLDKAIDSASESVDKNAASVVVMVRALQSGTLSSSEFKKVKAELIAQAPEFQKSFDGDKISIEASELALQNYIKQLTTTVRVTAALAVVNDTLAKSIKSIVTGGKADNFGTKISEGLTQLGGLGLKASKVSEQNAKRLEEAFDVFKPENITKLIDDTFKKLGITFKDFAGTIPTETVEQKLARLKAAFEKFQNETIAKAQQFKKQFGDTFILPELETSFFVSKDQVFKNALKVLSDVKKDLAGRTTIDNLQIKLPVLVTTETKLNADDLKKFLRGQITRDQVREIKVTLPVVTDLDIQLAESLAKEFEPTKDLIDNFFKGVGLEMGVPVTVTPDFTLAKGNLDLIDKKLDLRKQFSVLGDLGLKEFSKIDFSNINNGIAEATKRLEQMVAIATTLNQAIGQGLAGAFNAVFDAVLEGKSVFKALANAVKELIVSTIKAVVQMLILRAITTAIFPGGGAAAAAAHLSTGGAANFGHFTGIGGRAFSNVITVNVVGNISGDTINLAGQRAANSQGRFGG